MFRKLALGACLIGAVCVVGCKGEEKAPAPATPAVAQDTSSNDGAQAGAPPPAGLNPSYHSNPAADDARTGSALKGKK